MNRREFIKLGLAAAGASIFPSYSRSQGTEIKIGQVGDITGVLAAYGYWLQKSARSAVDKINAEGGIAKRKILYFMEDGGAIAQKGLSKFRKLVEEDHVDFVAASIHGGVGLATLPAIKELKTPTFFWAETTEITREKANRYAFRIKSNAQAQAYAAVDWALKNLGKKWSYFVADYAWGKGHEYEWSHRVEQLGGKTLSRIYVPLGTKDFIPYLTKIDPQTEVLFNAFYGAEAIGFLQQSYKLISKNMYRLGPAGIDGVNLEPLQEEAEDSLWCVYLPWELSEVPENIRPYNQVLMQANGVAPDGTEIANPKHLYAPNYYWCPWEMMYLIKQGIEISGWKSKEDHPKFIKAIEGIRVKPSIGFPQGELWIRAEDHQAFHDQWIGTIKKGKFKTIVKLPLEKSVYPSTINLTKESF